ncbi:MAG: DUF423 domain-containing protein [Bacteroidia bacterium]|nr:DUF423 domain-containing protein [Bacteroidia bacterium]
MNNTTKLKTFLYLAVTLGALAIILGAFSAHALENLLQNNKITQHHFNVFEKAVKYQMYHAIVLLILAFVNIVQNQLICQKSIYSISMGIICFSGSLYWIALQNIIHLPFPHSLFWITPLGGLLMIVGWILIPFEIFSQKNTR